MAQRKIWKNGLLILLIFQIIVAISLAVFTLVNFPGILEQFGIRYQPDMGILQFIMIYNLFLSLSVCLWGVVWIRKNNIAGVQIGTTVGLLLLVVSVSVFIKFNKLDILLFDGIRGFLMLVFGVLAYKDHSKHLASIS